MFISTAFAASKIDVTRDQTVGGLTEFFTRFFTAIPFWIAAGVVFFASFFLATFLKKIIIFRITSRAKYEMNQEVIILIERTIHFSVILLGALVAFQMVGINIATILGFVGLGFGFAFKDLLANFIAGVVILTQKKFQLGDKIRIGEIRGRIIEIETRTTVVKDFDGTLHIIPNAEMLTSTIQNYTKNPFRRIEFIVGVHYETPLKEVVQLTKSTVEAHPDVVEEPAVQVLVTEFGESSINLKVRFWIESTTSWPRVRSEVMQEIKKVYDNAGVTIPFPIRTLTLDEYDKNLLQAFNVQVTKEKPFIHKDQVPSTNNVQVAK